MITGSDRTHNSPVIETERTRLIIPEPVKAPLMAAYYRRNRLHLQPWEPDRAEDFYTEQGWYNHLHESRRLLLSSAGFRFAAMNHAGTEVLGVCNFTQVVGNAFQACTLGYSVDQTHQGSGLMFEILEAGLEFIFTEIGLHRIMANYMPRNHRSGRLLQRLGFEQEGLAKSYLKIAGRWEDHLLTAKINPDPT